MTSMNEVKWLSDEEAAAWRGLILMNQLLMAQIERDSMVDANLSGADYAVLVTLSEDETHQVRMTDLAKRMTWSKSRLSHQVARMERRGLVERRTCGEDGRGQWLTLTKPGLETIQSAAPAHVDSVRRHLFSVLSPVQVTQLHALTKAVIDNLQKTTDLCDGLRDDTDDVRDVPLGD
jgi:DNA-binding MarR family transcriptional regulator